MELNCIQSQYNKTYWPRSVACKDSLALHVIKFVQITGFRKYSNLCAEFEALMGKNSNLVSF